MFRPMQRFKQQLPEEECIEILKTQLRGVLSVQGDDGYPYGIPMNHYYNPEDGRLYFHSGKTGHKIDAMKRNPKASFCVYDGGYQKPGEWALNIHSVVVFGSIEIIEDQTEILRISRLLSQKFTSDESYIDREIARSGARTFLFALVPAHMTGKLVNES